MLSFPRRYDEETSCIVVRALATLLIFGVLFGLVACSSATSPNNSQNRVSDPYSTPTDKQDRLATPTHDPLNLQSSDSLPEMRASQTPTVSSGSEQPPASQSSGIALVQPIPIPVETIARNEVKRVEFNHYGVREAFERIDFRINDDSIEKTSIENAVIESLNFLFANFGNPVFFKGLVELNVEVNPNRHAVMRLSEGGKRVIHLDLFNFANPIAQQYLVHELFHAFYQSDVWLRDGAESDIEGWASYAQYRFLHRDLPGGNKAILEKLIADFPGAAVMAETIKSGKQPLESLSPSNQTLAYVGLALPIFNFDDYGVFVRYRSTIMRGRFPAESIELSSAETYDQQFVWTRAAEQE